MHMTSFQQGALTQRSKGGCLLAKTVRRAYKSVRFDRHCFSSKMAGGRRQCIRSILFSFNIAVSFSLILKVKNQFFILAFSGSDTRRHKQFYQKYIFVFILQNKFLKFANNINNNSVFSSYVDKKKEYSGQSQVDGYFL